jgi:hypothetical protein
MRTLFFTVREWNRFAWSMQEVLCIKYNVILTDYKTRKEKIILLLNKINVKNLNKGTDAFNKSLNQFCKIIDSFTRSIFKDFDQGKSMAYTFGRVKPISKDEIWGNANSVRLWGKPIPSSQKVSIWPEKPIRLNSDTSKSDILERIWGKRNDG